LAGYRDLTPLFNIVFFLSSTDPLDRLHKQFKRRKRKKKKQKNLFIIDEKPTGAIFCFFGGISTGVSRTEENIIFDQGD